MKPVIGDVYSLAVKGARRLHTNLLLNILRPYTEELNRYYGLPVTSDEWRVCYYAIYKFLLTLPEDHLLIELFTLLAYVRTTEDYEHFKLIFYKLLGIQPIETDPRFNYASRVADVWFQQNPEDRQKLLEGWHELTHVIHKEIEYSFYQLSSTIRHRNAANPQRNPKLLSQIQSQLSTCGAIPNGSHVEYMSCNDEDYYWLNLGAQKGKDTEEYPYCQLPGLVVYNRKHALLRTHNIARDVHHLRCIINCFAELLCGDGAAFLCINTKLVKFFSLWGTHKNCADGDGVTSPYLRKIDYAGYNGMARPLSSGDGKEWAKHLKDDDEPGYVDSIHLTWQMHDYKGHLAPKTFSVYSGNKIVFERGCEEHRIIDWLVENGIVLTSDDRINTTAPCHSLKNRLNWMKRNKINEASCGYWEWRELLGSYFDQFQKYLQRDKDRLTDYYRMGSGAAMAVIKQDDIYYTMWDARVGEIEKYEVSEKELSMFTLKAQGFSALNRLADEQELAARKKRKGGRPRGDSAEGADMNKVMREIDALIAKGMNQGPAAKIVHSKYKLLSKTVDSLAREYRRWKEEGKAS